MYSFLDNIKKIQETYESSMNEELRFIKENLLCAALSDEILGSGHSSDEGQTDSEQCRKQLGDGTLLLQCPICSKKTFKLLQHLRDASIHKNLTKEQVANANSLAKLIEKNFNEERGGSEVTSQPVKRPRPRF